VGIANDTPLSTPLVYATPRSQLLRAAWRTKPTSSITRGQIMQDSERMTDFAKLDDTALLSVRARMRAELERLPPHSPGHVELSARYDLSTQEIDDRARDAWSVASKGATS
jgi:hypothetical protein